MSLDTLRGTLLLHQTDTLRGTLLLHQTQLTTPFGAFPHQCGGSRFTSSKSRRAHWAGTRLLTARVTLRSLLGMNIVHSDRLRLVPATADLVAMERRCPAELGKTLQCAVHEAWPPQSVRDVLERFETTLRERPSEVGWHAWYWIASEPQGPMLVGNGGFKGL